MTTEQRRSSVKDLIVDEVTDQIKNVLPGSVQVSFDNTCATPVKIFVAQNPESPSMQEVKEYTAPSENLFPINSPYIRQSKATFILRVGAEQAILLRCAHASKVRIEVAPHGLNISSNDDVEHENFAEPYSVPQIETVPMVLKKESFATSGPPPRRRSTIRDVVETAVTDGVAPHKGNVQLTVDNSLKTPVKFFVARDAVKPRVENAIEQTVAAESSLTVSAVAHEGKAKVIMRIGMEEAMIFAMAHGAKIRIEAAPHGLKVTSNDDVEPIAYAEPKTVPNLDTVPMILRKESFTEKPDDTSGTPLLNGAS